jgi:TonB family protein
MFSLRHIVISFLILLFLPLFSLSQEVNVPPDSRAGFAGVYQSSTEGLRAQLQEILDAAKDHNRPKLESLTKQMQIPNYEEWFTTTFGREKGGSWAEPYGRDLAKNQENFETLFLQMAADDGEINTRKVNDNPGPPGGMEAGMINGVQGPVDFYFAGWKKRGSPQDSKSDPIGYFVFLDGKFRWDSTINFIKIQPADVPGKAAPPGGSSAQTSIGRSNGPFHPGFGGVTYPSCTFCPDPEYTREARAKHIEGTVVLRVIIQPDGRATDITIIKTPDAGLAEKAVEAVSKWRFKPARGEDHEPVPVIVPIEVTFRLLY